MAKRKNLSVQGKKLSFYTEKDTDYISLTDIDREFNGNGRHIENWLRNQNTIEFLETWEEIHNPDFNSMQIHEIKEQIGLNRFLLSAKKWIELTQAMGITARAGRYGGTFAHPDIAFNFCYWLSPRFQLYVAKEFQRLKELEAEQREDQFRFDVRRELTKINWHRHQEAVKLLQPRKLDIMGERYIFANEADLLNLALFGKSAKKWKEENPDKTGNIRDYASIEQLTVLANLENINALLIEHGFTQDERLQLLNEEAIKQMDSLLQYDRAGRLRELNEEEG